MESNEFYQKHGYRRDMECRLRQISKGKKNSMALNAANQISHLKSKIETLEQGLRIITGEAVCADNLMSNAALAAETLKLSGDIG